VNRDELMAELAALVDELCDTHLHHEVVWDDNGHRRKRMRRVYTTTQDGLLAQLREIGHEGLNVGGSSAGAGGKPGSKPPGLFEAMSRHVYIAGTVASWCRVQGVALRMSVEDNIRGLVGAASSMDDNTLGRFVREVRYWRGQAATATGWVAQPFHPWISCPTCGRQSTLSISMTEDGRGVRSAYCGNTDRDTPRVTCSAGRAGTRLRSTSWCATSGRWPRTTKALPPDN
jgi:Zn ribbon nucleic-acid-binding protein